MSDKAKQLLQEAVNEYLSGDGASRLGSYRDAITDILHLAHDDEILRTEFGDPKGKDWIDEFQPIVDESVFSFEEEREIAESKKVNEIALKDLPLYIDHDWEYNSSMDRVEERLRQGK